MCSRVINTHALPSVKTPHQGQLAWRVAKDSYQACTDFCNGMRIELFFLGWKGTCNSSISYYTILTQWKKITTPQKLQTCVCVGGPNTWWYTKSHAEGSSRFLLKCSLCYQEGANAHRKNSVSKRRGPCSALLFNPVVTARGERCFHRGFAQTLQTRREKF